jgi:hypothetical protein
MDNNFSRWLIGLLLSAVFATRSLPRRGDFIQLFLQAVCQWFRVEMHTASIDSSAITSRRR